MHMVDTDRALAEHREATMPEILARNAEYEALPEVVRLRARVEYMGRLLLDVWHIAGRLPPGPIRSDLLALAESADNLPIAATLQEAA